MAYAFLFSMSINLIESYVHLYGVPKPYWLRTLAGLIARESWYAKSETTLGY
jgi:hypothetical protein